MASPELTEYERKRLENIKRNDELLASLNIHSKLADLSASAKRHRISTCYRTSPQKKAKSEAPVEIRRSLRKNPESPGLTNYFFELPTRKTTAKLQVKPKKSPAELTPLSMRDVSVYSEPDEPLVKKILSGAEKEIGSRVRASIDLESTELMPPDIARVIPGRILSIKLFPSADTRMVAVGNEFGDLGFWNVDSEQNEDDDEFYMYRPHPSSVSSICIQPFAMNKIVTCCYHGLIRTLDIQKETFDLTYHCEDENEIFSMSQRSDDVNSLYFGEGYGVLRVLDERSRSSSMAWKLHGNRINTIDFNPENTNIMATSCSNGTACIWDLRKLGNPDPVKKITRDRAVHSAYFSPSGNILATTSLDYKVGVASGANYDDEFLLYHCNETRKGHASFMGVWGWDDLHVFVGGMERGVDVISIKDKRIITTLDSPHLVAIPCRFDAHPFKAGVFAGATSGGQVCVWSL